MAERRALIVASGDYEHDGLRRLRSPAADADALAEVLANPEIGGFDVEVVRDQPAYDIQARIEDLFSEARPDDVLLVHFSCHGLKSEAGELFFAARNTKPNRLASTAIPADFVQRCVRASRSRSIVLFLDCCYGGAFGQGVAVRAGGDVNVLDSFPSGRLGGGRGRAVISASNAVEYAFEGDALVDDAGVAPSHFTAALVQGLTTGEADRDEDGWVSLNELYDYVFDKVREASPNQTPSRDIEMQGELYLARSKRKRVRPVAVPPELQAAATDANMFSRTGAVAELRSRLLADNLPAALGARDLLATIARDDIEFVAQKAQAALAEAQLVVSESPVRFGAVMPGTTRTRRVALSGPPIALAVTVTPSDSWIRLTQGDGWVDVEVGAVEVGDRSGAITFAGPVGELVVPVQVDAAAAPVAEAPVVEAPVVEVSPVAEVQPIVEPVPVPEPAASGVSVNAPEPPSRTSPQPPSSTVSRPERRSRLGLPQWLVLASLVIILGTTPLPWFDEQLTLIHLNWNSESNGIFLPEWWLIVAVLLIASAMLLRGVWLPVAMGLAGVAGFDALWLSVFAAAAPSDILYGGFVYLAAAVVLLAGVALWVWPARAEPPSWESSRPFALAGSVLIIVPEVILLNHDQWTLSIAYFISVLALSAAILLPPRISNSVRIAALSGFSANAVIAVGPVISYLSRFASDDSVKITDSNGRLAIEAVVTVGIWIALARPRVRRESSAEAQ